MALAGTGLEPLLNASAPDAVARIALEASLDATAVSRGIVAALDAGTGRLYAVLGVGLGEGGIDRLRPPILGGPRHPFIDALRHGYVREYEPRDLSRPPLQRLRALGLRSATLIPIPVDVTVSPCVQQRRCLTRDCPVGDPGPAAAPEAEWLARVQSGCLRATPMRARAALVLDAHGLAEPLRRELVEIADAAGRSLRRFPEALAVGVLAPAAELEEEWRRRAFDAVDEPVLVADAQATLLFANAPARRLLTPGPADGEGRRRAVDFNRMLLAAWLTSYARLAEAERPRELALVDPEDGGELLFELLATSAYNSVARETGTVLVLKDVSDLRHSAEELEGSLRRAEASAESAQREREQLRLVIESIDQPIVVADPTGAGGEGALATATADVIRMNEAARVLLQAENESSQRRREIVQRNDAIVTSFLSQVGIGGGQASAELALTDPASERARSYAAHAAVARDELGAAAAIVCILSDLTELRELERRRVERQLFESEKLAATGRLAASFAHEINNPLEAMKNSLYLLANELSPEDGQRKYVDIARTETERISRTVRQILGFYRPSVVRAPTDLNAVVAEVAELMAVQMRKAGVACELDLDPALPQIVASADQLKQVFLNLILNSLQALPRGGRVTVTTRTDGAPRRRRERVYVGSDTVVAEVRDDGAGIPAEVRERLFEPFVTTKERAGTGLGLWICREIMHAHGGTIAVDSEVGRGTAFSLVLPVTAKEQTA